MQLITRDTKPWFSPKAHISTRAKFGPGCCIFADADIHENVVCEMGVQIGRNTEILPNTIVPAGAIIGDNKRIDHTYEWRLHKHWNRHLSIVN